MGNSQKTVAYERISIIATPDAQYLYDGFNNELFIIPQSTEAIFVENEKTSS